MENEQYMETALSLARSVAGQTSPNPPVGSVVVKDGRVIGMGAHMKAGESHAEKAALEMAGEQAGGADLYVTLEPCSHTGKTPPCADAVIAAGIRRVWVAVTDPNPLVQGRGIERLQAAGIEVHVGMCKRQAMALYEPFFHFIRTNQPHVTMKTAMTLDGKIATATGDSKWVTSEQARHDVHLLRDAHDAILVGVQTILHDDPLLTTRLPQGGKHPIRVILDTHLRTPADSNIVQNNEAPTLIVCGKEASTGRQQQLERRHVEIIRLATADIVIEDVLLELGKRGIMTLFVEGGAAVNASFVKADAVQRVIVYMAPKVLGGKNSLTPVAGDDVLYMNEALSLDIQSVEMIGPDVKITAVPKGSE